MDLHRLGEARSLAMHRAIAARLATEPTVLERARSRVKIWLASDAVHPTYARAWGALLEQPVERIARDLVDPSERFRELRQVTPFAGVLDPRTRWVIWRDVGKALR